MQKKGKKLVTRFHIFVHFDNQLLWKESFPMNVERTMRLGDPAKGTSINDIGSFSLFLDAQATWAPLVL